VQLRTYDKEAPMNYGLAYRIGFHPWEDAEEQPSFTETFSTLLDREEAGRQPPYGPALDVGESGFEAPKPVELLVKPEEHWYRLLRK
jgi:hypothetical protein